MCDFAPEDVTAVILAGGLGTRLRGIIGEMPKPMAPVLGKPFIEWIIQYLRREGLRRVIISAGYRADILLEHFHNVRTDGMNILVATEPSPLGTAGGFREALRSTQAQSSNWLVLNGDSLVATPLTPLLNFRQSPGFFSALLAVWMDDASRYGSLDINPKNHLTAFREKSPGPAWVNAGVYLVSNLAAQSLADKTPLGWEHDVFPNWLTENRKLQISSCKAPFLDIGVPEDFEKATPFLIESGLSGNGIS